VSIKLGAYQEQPSFIVVTPLLTEIDRFIESCREAEFQTPEYRGKTKTDNFHDLLRSGHNIVTTHSLWANLSRESFDLLANSNYILFIDEALECAGYHTDISKSDFKLLRENGLISIADDGLLIWNEDEAPNYTGKFDKAKRQCLNGNLYLDKTKSIYWVFPADFFTVVKEVWLLTYLWNGSPMDVYLKSEGFLIHLHSIENYALTAHFFVNEADIRAELRELIELIDDKKLNGIGSNPKDGSRKQALCSSWFKKGTADQLLILKKHIYNFFNNRVSGGARFAMWTCFKPERSKLKGNKYSNGFIPCNAKATNKYRHCCNLAYPLNRFMNPPLKNFLERKGMKVDEDKWALSEMLQWMFRSAIRDGEPITLYIPSERMRGLLMDWLNPKPVELSVTA
jgi:hypothetical protein